MTDENNQIKFFLYENWARTKTGQHTVLIAVDCKILFAVRSLSLPQNKKRKDKKKKTRGVTNLPKKVNSLGAKCRKCGFSRASYTRPAGSYDAPRNM